MFIINNKKTTKENNMNKLKKIGLTALAGSLVSTSVFAGEMAVTGSAGMSFGGADKGTSANGFSMTNSVYLAGSGEMDNGLTVSMSFEMDQGAANNSSNGITIDAGDMGTVVFAGHGGDSVVSAVDDVMPTAYGESWDIISNTVDTGGVTSTASTLFGASW